MDSSFSPYLGAALFTLVGAHFSFAVALKIKRNDLADVLWGPGFLVAAAGGIFGLYFEKGAVSLGSRDLILLTCVLFWAARLSLHIGRRFAASGREDTRYLNWRKTWGASWKLRSYLQVFMLQAIALILIALPITRALGNAPTNFSLSSWLGFAIWIFGFVFEWIADEQLRRFKANPGAHGKIMTQGLWSWSRHPNYFGESVQWWGIFILAYESGAGWTVISPLLITFLIVKVSGVPMLEELMERRAGFAEYKARTSVFIPLPPRSGKK